MKKRIFSMFVLTAILLTMLSFPASGASAIGVYITKDNGQTFEKVNFSDVQPIIVEGRTLIPVRGLFEDLGYSVSWNQSTLTAIVKSESREVQIPIGQQYMLVNGKKVSVSVPAQIINSRTMIPVRAVSEALELKVEWDNNSRSVIVYAINTADDYVYDNFGSAGYIKDKTVIVSIFAGDTTTSWDFTKNADNAEAARTLEYLKTATKWLESNVSAYNVNADFVYDWAKDSELVYSVQFYHPLVTSGGEHYYDQVDYINKFIDTEKLLEKYDAKNIIYMFFINTPASNQHNPWSLSKTQYNSCNTEIINIFHRFDDKFITQPSTYAHELMHCFGAKDLYYKNDYITQSYVDHCRQTNSNDIMYTVNIGDTIENEFSVLDAYYMGLTDNCSEVATWNLKPSDYVAVKNK